MQILPCFNITSLALLSVFIVPAPFIKPDCHLRYQSLSNPLLSLQNGVDSYGVDYK